MEDRENIPEIDPEQGLTAQQAAERTPAGTPVYPGKTEQEIIEARERAISALTEKGYEIVNTLFTDEWYSKQAMEARGVDGC